MSLITTDWLDKNINNENIKILDCSWHMPNTKRIGKEEFLKEHIPNAIFFDIDKFSDPLGKFPHTIPPKNLFEKLCSEIGIKNSDHIIVYDSLGIFSSPRVWWMFNYFGHNNVSILNGGLIKWKNENKKLANGEVKNISKSNFKCSTKNELLTVIEQIHENIQNRKFDLIDARSKGRFEGTDPEPRPEIKSGSIPNSFNIPWSECIDPVTKCFLSEEDLKNKFKKIKINKDSNVVFSCGSGVTACIIAKAFDIIGGKKFSIYDGSWTEWANQHKDKIIQ
jgi:thiosulfate/3-mercaptopyruvate sulfurtransferase